MRINPLVASSSSSSSCYYCKSITTTVWVTPAGRLRLYYLLTWSPDYNAKVKASQLPFSDLGNTIISQNSNPSKILEEIFPFISLSWLKQTNPSPYHDNKSQNPHLLILSFKRKNIKPAACLTTGFIDSPTNQNLVARVIVKCMHKVIYTISFFFFRLMLKIIRVDQTLTIRCHPQNDRPYIVEAFSAWSVSN